MTYTFERSATDVAVLERLMYLVPEAPRGRVVEVVRQCRRDLAGAPPGAMPELVERLARQRLAGPGAR